MIETNLGKNKTNNNIKIYKMKHDISKKLNELMKKECQSSEELKDNLVSIFREYAMENNTTELCVSLALTEDVKFSIVPLRMDVIKSPMGPIMMNSFIKTHNKKYECSKINMIIEMTFGVGLSKKEEQTKEEFRELGQSISKQLTDLAKKTDNSKEFLHEVLSMEMFDEYMIVNEFRPEGVTMKSYDLIRGTDPKTGRKEDFFLISDKPDIKVNTEVLVDFKDQIENYF